MLHSLNLDVVHADVGAGVHVDGKALQILGVVVQSHLADVAPGAVDRERIEHLVIEIHRVGDLDPLPLVEALRLEDLRHAVDVVLESIDLDLALVVQGEPQKHGAVPPVAGEKDAGDAGIRRPEEFEGDLDETALGRFRDLFHDDAVPTGAPFYFGAAPAVVASYRGSVFLAAVAVGGPDRPVVLALKVAVSVAFLKITAVIDLSAQGRGSRQSGQSR